MPTETATPSYTFSDGGYTKSICQIGITASGGAHDEGVIVIIKKHYFRSLSTGEKP